MAKSGTFKNYICGNADRPGYTLRTYWSSTPDVANNRSKVLCDHYLDCGSGWDLYIGARSGTSNVGGDVKNFTKDGISQGTGGGSHKLGTTEHWIRHNNDGTKTVTATTTFNFNAKISGTQYDNIVATGVMVLDDIPRASTIETTDGILGKAQSITIKRNVATYTDTITFKCGNATGTVVTKSSKDSEPWTPPLSLASQNTTGNKVTVTLTVTTYNGDQVVGSNSIEIECTIPNTVKPTAALTVTDGKGYLATYGGYVQGMSTFKVTVKGTPIYNSAIQSYSTKINNGSPYTSSLFETGPITDVGTYNIVANVTDARGNTGTDTKSVTVLEYYLPKLTITATRCDENFEENVEGNNIRVDISYNVAPLNNKNELSIIVKWRKSGTTKYTEETLTGIYQDEYELTIQKRIPNVDLDSSYEIEVSLTDKFNTTSRATKVGSAFTFFHFDGPTGNGTGKNKLNLIDSPVPGSVVKDVDYSFEDYTYSLLEEGSYGGLMYSIPDTYNLPAGSKIRFSTTILDSGGMVRLYAAYEDASQSATGGVRTDNIATFTYTDGSTASYFEYTTIDTLLMYGVEFLDNSGTKKTIRFRRPIVTIDEDDMTYEAYIIGVPPRLGIGKIAELDNGVDFGLKARFNAGFEFPILRQYTDFDTLLTPNFYIGANVATYQYINCPITGGTFYLEIVAAGENAYRQTVTTCSKEASVTYERFYNSGSWGPWRDVYHGQEVLYDNSAGNSGTVTLLKNTSNFAFIDIYFQDNNSKDGGYVRITNPNGKTILLSMVEPGASATWIRRTMYTISGSTMTPTTSTTGYVRLNASGVTHDISVNHLKIIKVMGIR